MLIHISHCFFCYQFALYFLDVIEKCFKIGHYSQI